MPGRSKPACICQRGGAPGGGAIWHNGCRDADIGAPLPPAVSVIGPIVKNASLRPAPKSGRSLPTTGQRSGWVTNRAHQALPKRLGCQKTSAGRRPPPSLPLKNCSRERLLKVANDWVRLQPLCFSLFFSGFLGQVCYTLCNFRREDSFNAHDGEDFSYERTLVISRADRKAPRGQPRHNLQVDRTERNAGA